MNIVILGSETNEITASDPAAGWGGPRNMKSMRPPLVAIFFMTSFYRTAGGGGMAPLAPPPESATEIALQLRFIVFNYLL